MFERKSDGPSVIEAGLKSLADKSGESVAKVAEKVGKEATEKNDDTGAHERAYIEAAKRLGR